MSASVLISIIALTFAFATAISVTVLVSRSLANAFRTIESMHTRSYAALDKTLDRLMAIKWEDFVAMQNIDEGEDGGFFAPDEQEDETPSLQQPGLWGRLVTVPEDPASREEQLILDEDFPLERG